MTSKNSTSNISLLKLMKEDIHHKTWMIALSALASFLFGPVAFSFVMSSYETNIYNPAYTRFECYSDYLTTTHLYFQMTVAVVGAIIVAIFTFRQMYSKRMMDLYHSAPVSRTKLFLSGYINGFLVWFVPFFLCQLFVYLTAIITLHEDPSLYGTLLLLFIACIGLGILGYLIVYHACLVPVMVSGNLINAYVNVMIYGLIVGIAYACFIGNCESYFDTFYSTSLQVITGPIPYLTPLATPFVLVYCASELAFAHWKTVLIGGILVMLVNGVLGFFLYKKRPSELAERGLENKVFQHIFRIAVSLVSGMLFSLFFHMISGDKIGWSIFGVLFGSALSFCILNIIYHVGFKSILKHKVQLGAILFAGVFCVLALYLDILGYDNYIPAKSSIKGFAIACNNSFSDRTSDYIYEDGYVIRDNRLSIGDDFGTVTFTNKDDIYNFLTAAVRYEYNPWDSGAVYTIYTRIDTVLGSYYRAYSVDDHMLDVLRPFIEDPEYQADNYRLQTGNLGLPESIRVMPIGNQTNIIISDKTQIQELIDAFSKDFYENNSIEALATQFPLFEMGMEYPYKNTNYNTSGTVNFYYDVNAWSKHTLAFFKKWYPEYAWDSQDLEISKINFNITLPQAKLNSERIDAVIDYFAPIEQQSMDWQKIETGTLGTNSYLEYLISDPTLIKALHPYLITGYYFNDMGIKDYVHFGEVTTENGYNISCFVKRGSLPKELLEQFALGGTYTDEYHYVDDEIYFDANERYVY